MGSLRMGCGGGKRGGGGGLRWSPRRKEQAEVAADRVGGGEEGGGARRIWARERERKGWVGQLYDIRAKNNSNTKGIHIEEGWGTHLKAFWTVA